MCIKTDLKNVFDLKIFLPPRLSLDCLAVDCTVHHQPRCCSSHHQAVGRSLKPLANWRFGSIFRNSIPPVRPYKVPTFEEIFEVDHSATTEAAQHVLLNLNQADGGGGGGGHQQNMMTFSNQLSPSQLSENNRNSQIESPSSSNKYMYEDIFGSSRDLTSTTQSYEELRTQKLLERAKQELVKKQRMKAQRIKSQQKQEKLLKLTNYLQQQKKKISEKTPRSQQLDDFFSKIQGFSSSKTSQFKPDFNKKYQAKAPSGLIKKSDQQEEFHAGWRKKRPGSGFSKFNGQQYLDKSMETKILDSSLAGSGSLAEIASQKTRVQSSRHDVVTTGEDIVTLDTRNR